MVRVIKRWCSLLLFSMLLAIGVTVVWSLCCLDRIFRFRFGFPRDLESLAEAQPWCLSALQRAGALPQSLELISYQVVPFRADETLRSQMARVDIAFRRDVEGVIETFSCLAKCAPSQGSLWNHTIYVLQGNCNKEVGFYHALSTTVQGLVPGCYFAGVSEGTGHFCLLLELIEDARELREEEGCPRAQAAIALAGLAQIHAAFWGFDAKPYKWLDVIPAVFVDLFLCLFGRELDVVYQGHSRDIWARCGAPQTVLHGDARVGNMLFPAAPGRPFVLFDWQATRLGLAVCDVAYLLVLSVETEVRLAHEEALVREYHQALCDAGVSDYPWAVLWEDYHYACLLLGQMFGLPFLSSEISVDDPENQAKALSGGLVWSQRGHACVAQMDEVWLRETLGMERAALLAHTEHTLLFPHRMNHGAQLVADYLKQHGGVDALYRGRATRRPE